MPKIQVIEKDLSWYYRQRERGPLTVYVPGLSTFGPSEPTLVSKDDFAQIFGGPSNISKDNSYAMAASWLKSGIDVVFQRIIPEGATKAQTPNNYHIEFQNNKNQPVKFTVKGQEYEAPAQSRTVFDFDLEDRAEVDSALQNYSKISVINNIEETKAYVVDKELEEISGETITYKYKVTVHNSTSTKLTVSVPLDPVFTFICAAGQTQIAEIPLVNADDQSIIDSAFAPYEIETYLLSEAYIETPEISTVIGNPEDYNGDYATIYAKYEGSFGNTLSIRVKGPSAESSVRYFYVYSGATLIDNMIIDFSDVTSPYYIGSLESNYIDIVINGEFHKEWFPEGSSISLSYGSDYALGTDPRVSAISQMASKDFFKDLKDSYLYQFDLLVNGGFIYSDSYEAESGNISEAPGYKIDAALIDVAESKGNCVYLMSGSDQYDAEAFYNYCNKFNTSFASAIGPWCFCELVYNGVRSLLPGYYPFLVAWGNSLATGTPVWYAPAGVNRAKCSVVKSTKYPVGNAILELWQNHDFTAVNDFKINPIMNLKQYGYCVYGNSTLLHNKADGSSSMLQSLGTRILVNQIKLKAFDIALSLQFDQLTDDLFVKFKTLMGTYMDQIKYSGGLYDYKIIVDRSSVTFTDLNQKTVPVIIKISPNPAAENFNIVCEVSRAGLTFTDEYEA